MGTVIDHVSVTDAGWRGRRSALHLATTAAKDCLRATGTDARDIDLLINAGIYRDRNLGEPALAALIQQDIGANPEDPHAHGHGTFSFDVANGSCGVLNALQIVDGFLTSHAIDRALIVASDADPGHRMSRDFPFSPTAAALLCRKDARFGLQRIHWKNNTDYGESFRATVGLAGRRNVLRFAVSDTCDDRFAAVAGLAAEQCLRESDLRADEVDALVAAPAHEAFRTALAGHLGIAPARITVADDPRTHTASLAAAFRHITHRAPAGGRVLIIAAGAGVTAGAALYQLPTAVAATA